MRVLFSALNAGAIRNYDSVLRELSARGHQIRLVVHSGRGGSGSDDLVARAAALPGVELELRDDRMEGGLRGVRGDVRAASELLHFLHPRFNETYRTRALRRAPRLLVRLARTGIFRPAAVRSVALAVLGTLERLLPLEPGIRALVRGSDVALLTPYIGLRTIQPDVLRAARGAGVPTGVCVASWDNLTSKALIRPRPDRVYVWNDVQRDEAVAIHRVPPGRVSVTGAQCFDRWFGREPSTRERFCSRVGLDAAEPYVLYACFTPFVRAADQDEPAFVLDWLSALRAVPDLAEVGVLIRPHPKRAHVWDDVDLTPHGPVVVWPRAGRLPTNDESETDYWDSIAHAAAVVGLNSTALVEAAIAAKPVLTVLADRFHESQSGTLHFHYLLEVGGGLLTAARSLPEHARQLADAVHGRDDRAAERARRFVEAFVRPNGLDQDATALFVDDVERLAGGGPDRQAGEAITLGRA